MEKLHVILTKLNKAERDFLRTEIEQAYGEGVASGYSTIPRFMHYELSRTKEIAQAIKDYDANATPDPRV